MGELDLELRYTLMRRFGTSGLSYAATVQEALEYFGDQRGFIAFKRVGRTSFVLSDPIADPKYYRNLILEFIAHSKSICFCQISRMTAEILSELNFRVNEAGLVTRVDIQRFDISGRPGQKIRQAMNRIARNGFTIKELNTHQIDPFEIEKVSILWRQGRPLKNRETTFITRPFKLDEPEVRKFLAFDAEGKLAGFNFYDPFYFADELVGYTENNSRKLLDVDEALNKVIQVYAIEKFRQEGLKWLELGINPFAEVEKSDFKDDYIVRKLCQYISKSDFFNRRIYSVKGLNRAKNRGYHRAEYNKVYLAFNRGFGFTKMLPFMKACSII